MPGDFIRRNCGETADFYMRIVYKLKTITENEMAFCVGNGTVCNDVYNPINMSCSGEKGDSNIVTIFTIKLELYL